MGTYSTGWKQWKEWRKRINMPVYLSSTDSSERSQLNASEELVEFMMQCYSERKNRASTISGKISAIAYYHKMWGGIQIPSDHFLIQAVKKGITRSQGLKGHNVTKVRCGLTWSQIELGKTCGLWACSEGGLVMWYGIAMSYILLARASELWADDKSGKAHLDYGLIRKDLTFCANKKTLRWDD